MTRTSLEKNREYQRKWWAANKETQRERIRANNAKFRKEMQALKLKPCIDCGFQPVVSGQMEWDHIGNDKVANVSQMINNGNRKKILEEIAKCELVCRNCHALRTATRLGDGPNGLTELVL